MPRRKGMKLDQALKLYIAVYVVCFAFTFLISVPMIIHVAPKNECLLFVTPNVEYGPAAACYFVGFGPLMVAGATLILMVLHIVQLRSLKSYLRKPGHHSSRDYHSQPTHIFWRIVVFHGIVTLCVAIITGIVTSGYAATCENLYQDVSLTVRKRITLNQNQFGQEESQRQKAYEKFADDVSIDRYTNDYKNPWGRSNFEQGITCRNMLTDPDIHSELKQKHATDPFNQHYYGSYFLNKYADVGDLRYLTYRDNTILEMAMAGSWISFVLWIIVLVLMIKERHHIKAHLTDESMWGSEFGSASRRSMGSRMSNQSFDKMSGSYRSGSRYSRSSRPTHDPSGQRSMNMTRDISYIQSNGDKPLATSQPSSRMNQKQELPPNSLLDYFSTNPPLEEEVDVDAALNDQILDNQGVQPSEITFSALNPEASYMEEPDTSFDMGFPTGLDQTDCFDNDPIPLGDEVSMGVISRESENFNNHVTTAQMPNPSRQTGRRGGRQTNGMTTRPQPQPQVKTWEVNQRMVQRERYQLPRSTSQQSQQPPPGYRTQLGKQAMI